MYERTCLSSDKALFYFLCTTNVEWFVLLLPLLKVTLKRCNNQSAAANNTNTSWSVVFRMILQDSVIYVTVITHTKAFQQPARVFMVSSVISLKNICLTFDSACCEVNPVFVRGNVFMAAAGRNDDAFPQETSVGRSLTFSSVTTSDKRRVRSKYHTAGQQIFRTEHPSTCELF